MLSSPAAEYEARLEARRRAHAGLTAADARLAALRLATFAVGAILALIAWRTNVPWWTLLVPGVAFGALMARHDRVIQARNAAARAIQFYEHGLARITDRWTTFGEPGERFRSESHLYANDLDLFGQASLFQLLSIARTRAGEERLAAWLSAPAAASDIRARQGAIQELAPELDLRENLAQAGSDVRASVNSEALAAWAEGAPVLRQAWLRAAAVVLAAAAVATAAYWAIAGDYTPFLYVIALEIFYSVPQRARIQQALHAAEGPARDLDVLAHVLSHLEAQAFTAPHLVALRQRLDVAGVRASHAIARLHRLVELHDWQHNQFFAPFAATVLWGTHLAWAIERWREQHGTHVRDWLAIVGEFEALTSLAAYHYEHPGDVWPVIREGGPATYAATGLGHPLLPAARMIRNDVHLAGETRLIVISGSNMSGKSTLLRTVGINAVLALAGAPVRATSLELSPLVIGATLRIQDSLQEGKSRFYAEITRLRELADAARGTATAKPPLLFLLDELLHGTNSHDRLVGSAGVLRSLVNRGAIGLITTHDLALTAIADELAPRAANMHFEDRFEGNEILFDYRVKQGPVTRSNAIALMRAVGLEVEDD